MKIKKSFSHPSFWPIRICLFVLRITTRLPLATQLRLGRWVGRLLYHTSRRRRQITQTNLSRAFPEYPTDRIKKMCRLHFESAGMGLFETFFGWWAHPDRILSCCTLEGLDILLQAQQTGRGILLVGPHFTTLEILGVAVALQAPIHVTYRKHNHPVLETLYLKNRAKYYRQSIDKDDSRSLIRSLKSGQTVWLAPDQNFSGKSKGFSPFFGIPAATMPVVSKLAKLTHAIIIPVSFKRTSPTGRYHFTFHPPLDHFPSEDARSDTDRINALFESFVREAPEQYLWSHRRFKTRPPNEPPFY